MSKITRRTMLAGGAALPLVAIRTGKADAAQFSYKFATNLPAVHPLNVRIGEALTKIKAESGGRLDITLFPNSVLGTDPVMLSQVRSGALQFFTLSPLILSTLVPLSAINGVGFAFKDSAAAFSAMDGKLGAFVRVQIATRGLIAFEKIFDNGFRQITTGNHPIRTPDDLHALRIRVPPAALWTSMFSDFGASPTTISFNEVYTSLQTKIVDGQENPLAIVSSAKLYEVQKYCSLTNHMWDGFWTLANPAAFRRLPPDLQALAERELNAAALRQRGDVASLNASLQTSLSTQGLTFNDTDPAQFRDALTRAGFYSSWKGKFGDQAWSLLEGYTGALG
jgi:tripartite ATP-independent transporter DctP family solute receptor